MKKTVLITRALDQAGEFAALLEEFGFIPLIFPTIEFAPPKESKKISETIGNISSYDWVLLTSVNGVKFFLKHLKKTGEPAQLLAHMKICAVGPKTAEVAEEIGLKIDLLPRAYQAEGVLECFGELEIDGQRILFPRAEEGRDVLPDGLKKMGAVVELLPVYRTIMPEGREYELKTILEKGVDYITFTSGSTVRNFISILGGCNLALLSGVKIACISEVTAGIALDLGIKTDILPVKNTARSLAEAINQSATR